MALPQQGGLDTGGPDPNNPIPPGINLSTISYISEFPLAPIAAFASNLCTTVDSPDNGDVVRFHSAKTKYDLDSGWTTVETVLVRINTHFTTKGTFPVYASNQYGEKIGYDAAICVQKCEPWIIETYNTSFASPSILRIVEKENGNTSLPSGRIQGTHVASTRHLNGSNKHVAFDAANGNSVYQMRKVNYGNDYFPTPVVGPVAPPRTTFLLTSTCSAGHFSHRWHWTSRIHRTLPRPIGSYPRTDWCS